MVGMGTVVGEVLWSYLVRIGRDLLSPTYNALATVNFDKSINTLVTIIEVHVIFQLYIENNQKEVLLLCPRPILSRHSGESEVDPNQRDSSGLSHLHSLLDPEQSVVTPINIATIITINHGLMVGIPTFLS